MGSTSLNTVDTQTIPRLRISGIFKSSLEKRQRFRTAIFILNKFVRLLLEWYL